MDILLCGLLKQMQLLRFLMAVGHTMRLAPLPLGQGVQLYIIPAPGKSYATEQDHTKYVGHIVDCDLQKGSSQTDLQLCNTFHLYLQCISIHSVPHRVVGCLSLPRFSTRCSGTQYAYKCMHI